MEDMDTMEDLVKVDDDNDDTGGRPVDALQYSGKVKKTYIPEGFDSVEDFIKDMREEYELDITFDDENRKEALEDKKFAAGEHWDPQVLKHREGLPNLTINTIPQFIAQLVGDWRQARNAVKVLPAEDGDVDVASVRSDLIRAIEYKSRTSRVYDNAFESAVQCGDGAFRVCVEYARDDVFEQDINLSPIDDALSVVWDRLSIDPTGRDARHVFVDDMIPTKEFERKWPDAKPDELSQRERSSCSTQGWIDDGAYRVTEYWRMIERNRLIGLFADGSVHEIEKDDLDEILATLGAPVKTRVAPCLYAQMHLVTGWAILDGPYEYRLNRLPVIRMSGRVINVGGRRIRYGLTRFMKDPARLRNFWRSVAAEQLGYAPKAQWMATESAVAGREELIRKAHLSRDPLLVFNDEAVFGQNVERVDPPQVQMALLNEAQINTQDMKDVTGIHDASLGIKSNETSGKAIMARQREGDVAAITFYDNGNAAILEAGDVINQLIPQVYDSTRVIRTIGEDEAPKLVKINDFNDKLSPNLSIGRYDVVPASGVSYTTKRAEAAEAMMQAVQVWPEVIGIAGDIIAKAQDWPGADKLAERLKKTIPQEYLSEEERDPNAQVMPPQMVQQMQMELEATKAELAQLQADKSIDMYNAETQRIRALSDNMVDDTTLNQNAIQMVLDHSVKMKQAEKPEAASQKKETK